MLVYVLIAVPVMVAFGVEITLWSIFFFIDVIVVRPLTVARIDGCTDHFLLDRGTKPLSSLHPH